MSDEEIIKSNDSDARKARKGLSFSINLGNLMSLAIVGMLTAMWGDIRHSHDELIRLSQEIPALETRVDNLEIAMGWRKSHYPGPQPAGADEQ